MAKYYKIITERSRFAHEYNIADVQHIPSGSQFVAKETEHDEYSLSLSGAFLHFADNEFDTMLWHDMIGWDEGEQGVLAQKGQIYEIKPLGPVIKERCEDYIRTFQCGAEAIEIVGPVNKAELFRAAIRAFEQDPMAKRRMYPELDIEETVSAWSRQERSNQVF